MATLSEKHTLLKDIRSLMSRVEALETKEEQVMSRLPFPEESSQTPERTKGMRFNDGSMLVRTMARFLTKRYGVIIDYKTIKNVLVFLKMDCNSRNSSHDWRMTPQMVKDVTELFDIFYKTETNKN